MTEQSAHDARAAHDQTEHLTFAEAAARLHSTPNAVRMRVHRGSLASVRVNDRTLVVWPQPARLNAQHAERTRAERRTTVHSDDRLIDRLESENEFLRSQLNVRVEEIRRRDHIIAGFIERLPELPAGEQRQTMPQDAHTAPLRGDQPEVVSERLIDRVRRLIGRHGR